MNIQYKYNTLVDNLLPFVNDYKKDTNYTKPHHKLYITATSKAGSISQFAEKTDEEKRFGAEQHQDAGPGVQENTPSRGHSRGRHT